MAMRHKMHVATLPGVAVMANNMVEAIGRTEGLKGKELMAAIRNDLTIFLREFAPNLTVLDIQVCADNIGHVLDSIVAVSVTSGLASDDREWRPADIHVILDTLRRFFGNLDEKEVVAVTVNSLAMYNPTGAPGVMVKKGDSVYAGIFGWGLRRFALKSTQDYNVTENVDGAFFCTHGLKYARTSLASLSLRGTGLGTALNEVGRGMLDTLCDTFLRDNMVLRHLDLGDNFLEDSDVERLAEQRMPALMSLYLDDNMVTSDVLGIIGTALQKRRFGLAELSVAENFVIEPGEGTWSFVGAVLDLMRHVMYLDLRGTHLHVLSSEQMDTLARHPGLCLFLTRGGFNWLYDRQKLEMHMVLVPGDYDTGSDRNDPRKWLANAYIYTPQQTLTRLADKHQRTDTIIQVTLLTRNAELAGMVRASAEFKKLFPAAAPPPSPEVAVASGLPVARRLVCPEITIPAAFLRAPIAIGPTGITGGVDMLDPEAYQWRDYWDVVTAEVRQFVMQTRILCVYQVAPLPIGGGSYHFGCKARLVMKQLLDVPASGPLGSVTVTFEDPDEHDRNFCRVGENDGRGHIIAGLTAFCHAQAMELLF